MTDPCRPAGEAAETEAQTEAEAEAAAAAAAAPPTSSPPVTTLKLTTALAVIPAGVLSQHGATLTQLDLSGTGLSTLPEGFGAALPALRVLFLSHNAFAEFPRALARCARLEMVAFRANGMRRVPEDALPPRLRWLILTNNELTALPASLGRCARQWRGCRLHGC